ncbi:MAG: MerR family transcriptional regulator [bacterium]
MNEKKTYSIEELAKITGITRRTVRFYVQRGLIPQPLGLGRGNHYTDDHLKKILKIQDLKREGLVLSRVDGVLNGQASVITEDFERDLVTSIKLAEGIHLEITHGAKVPSFHTLKEIQKIIKQTI